MTDLRTLLHDSAPAPRLPLDLAAVHRRAAQRGLRRLVTWLAALGAVVGLAAPLGAGVLSPADGGPSKLGVGPSLRTTSTSAPSPSPDAGRPSPPTTSAAPAGPFAAARATSTTLRGPGSVGASPPSSDPVAGEVEAPPAAAPSNAAYPAAVSCSVDDAGLAPNGQRRCRFTATTPGGASLRTTGPANPGIGIKGEVFVTHDGTTTRYEVQDDSVRAGELGVIRCGKFIEPGDLVEVVLTNSVADDGERSTLGAGEGWACYE